MSEIAGLPTDITEGLLCGFRRLCPRPPSLLIPIFRSVGGNKTERYYQSTDENGRVHAFVFDPQLSDDQLIPALGFGRIVLPKGSQKIWAYEVSPGEIFAENVEAFKKQLSEVLHSGQLSGNTFAALEIAHFLGDVQQEKILAQSATRELTEISPTIANSWAATSALSNSARSAALAILQQARLEALVEPKESAVPLEHFSQSESVYLSDNFIPQAAYQLQNANSIGLLRQTIKELELKQKIFQKMVVPIHWATITNNLAASLMALGLFKKHTGTLYKAERLFRDGLGEFEGNRSYFSEIIEENYSISKRILRRHLKSTSA